MCLLLLPALGYAADRDGDGIPDERDACPERAEDLDGDADDDGCPEDGDRDGDKIADSKDLCPTLAEDFDGDHDDDGCPDLQNDADEDGLANDRDLCPYEPEDHDGFEDSDGCPDPDNDADGIADAFDRCPFAPEDIDGFEDSDGCPELDNDADGIPDVEDQCPDQAEDLDGHEDEDGCPDLLVILTKKQIELRDTIYFAFDSAQILERSFPLLDDVVQILQENPELAVRIEGHTDADGEDDYNLSLSDQRAKSVMAYLVEHGVAAERLSAKGYGELRPVAPNDTEDGKAKNRRVDFMIVE